MITRGVGAGEARSFERVEGPGRYGTGRDDTPSRPADCWWTPTTVVSTRSVTRATCETGAAELITTAGEVRPLDETRGPEGSDRRRLAAARSLVPPGGRTGGTAERPDHRASRGRGQARHDPGGAKKSSVKDVVHDESLCALLRAKRGPRTAVRGAVRRRPDHLARIGDHRPDAASAAAGGPAQEGGPERLGLGRTDVHAGHLASAFVVDPDCGDDGDREDAAGLTHRHAVASITARASRPRSGGPGRPSLRSSISSHRCEDRFWKCRSSASP